MHHVHIDIIKKNSHGKKCTRCHPYSNFKNSQKSMVWHLHWNIHSPRTWTLLTSMNSMLNWQLHHVMDWLTCNRKNERINSIFVPLSKLKVGSDGFLKMILCFTLWLALFCWINLGKKGEGLSLWTIDFS